MPLSLGVKTQVGEPNRASGRAKAKTRPLTRLGSPKRYGFLVVRIQRRELLARRQQPAKRDRVNVAAEPGHVTIHEQRIATVAVKAKRLIIDAAVVGGPRTRGRSAERSRVVVDH